MKKTAIFFLILLLALLLRCFQLNSPSIGYHNMKENEALSVAQEMLRSADFINKRLYFVNPFQDNPAVSDNPQPAMISYQVILSWKILGENLWGVRLSNVIFGLGAVMVIYFLAILLFGDKKPALACSALLAIMPLAVFFSRNIQADSPAFFFMLLGNLFYLRFLKNFRSFNLLAGGLSFLGAWAYSFNYIFGALPFLFCVPFKQFAAHKKKALKSACAFILPYVLISLFAFRIFIAGRQAGQAFALPGLDIFYPAYWQGHGAVILWYIRGENFTPVFALLALMGVILAFLQGRGILNRYIIGWVFTALVYAAVYSAGLYQQNFAQMPFLAAVVICSVYCVFYISEGLKKIFKKEIFLWLFLAILALSAFFVYGSLRRMYSAVFLGGDVAGESLKEFTLPQERIFLHTYAQGYGIARYARRYMGWTADLDEFKKREKEFGIRYICFYPAEFAVGLKGENPSLYGYIRDNYHVKEIGFLDEPDKLFYIILERGEGSGKDFLGSFSGPKKLRTIYRLIGGQYVFFYSIRMPQEEKKDQ